MHKYILSQEKNLKSLVQRCSDLEYIGCSIIITIYSSSQFISEFLDWRQPGPIRLVLLVIIGWLVGLFGWLVGNAVFSEMALRIFLILCMKLGNYKGRKVTEPDFWKFLIWRYLRKGPQISPKSDIFIFFSKTVLTIFF